MTKWYLVTICYIGDKRGAWAWCNLHVGRYDLIWGAVSMTAGLVLVNTIGPIKFWHRVGTPVKKVCHTFLYYPSLKCRNATKYLLYVDIYGLKYNFYFVSNTDGGSPAALVHTSDGRIHGVLSEECHENSKNFEWDVPV